MANSPILKKLFKQAVKDSEMFSNIKVWAVTVTEDFPEGNKVIRCEITAKKKKKIKTKK